MTCGLGRIDLMSDTKFIYSDGGLMISALISANLSPITANLLLNSSSDSSAAPTARLNSAPDQYSYSLTCASMPSLSIVHTSGNMSIGLARSEEHTSELQSL